MADSNTREFKANQRRRQAEGIARQCAKRAAPPTPEPKSAAVGDEGAVIAYVVREVAELPDRDSPEGQPEMMLVTADELASILRAALQAGQAAGEEP